MLWWNRVEVDNIFSRLETVERSIIDLQEQEERDGGLSEPDMSI